ncbi:MAG: VOC family protein [Tannerellaceae bacterium]|nr:VOC family protein [Tannerellaceae bacterium]
MKNLVAFFEIPVADFSRAVKFYEEVFNCKLSIMESPTEKMAFFPDESGKCPGALSFAPDFKPSKDGVLVSLFVENMEEANSSIQENGGKIITPKTKIEAGETGYFSLFIDIEGNRVGLYSDK